MIVTWTVTLLCLLLNINCYADRTNMGIVLLSLDYSETMQGIVLSAFFYGYICTQVLGGRSAQHHGAVNTLVAGVLLWCLCDALTVLVYRKPPLLILCRIGMGIGEGVVYPCLHHLASKWFRKDQKTFLLMVVTSGMDLGTVMALLISPLIVSRLGWRYVFLFSSASNLMWILLFSTLASNTPQTHSFISSSEREWILSGSSSNSTERNRIENNQVEIDWYKLLRQKSFIAIVCSHISFNYGWYVLLGWTPQYFSKHLHVDLGKNSFLAALPYFCGFVGVIAAGRAADSLINAGYRIKTVRKLMNSVGLFSLAAVLILLCFAPNKWVAVGLFCVGLFLGRVVNAGYWTNILDVSPEHASVLMGVSNTFATIPGIVGNSITGYILETTRSWTVVFVVTSAVLCMGGIVYLLLADDEHIRIEKKLTKEKPHLVLSHPLLSLEVENDNES